MDWGTASLGAAARAPRAPPDSLGVVARKGAGSRIRHVPDLPRQSRPAGEPAPLRPSAPPPAVQPAVLPNHGSLRYPGSALIQPPPPSIVLDQLTRTDPVNSNFEILAKVSSFFLALYSL